MAGTDGASASMYERAERAAERIREAFGEDPPQVGVVLGSGLGAFAESLQDVRYLPYDEVPGFLRSTVVGHKGRLAFGTVGGVRVLCQQGRFHFYEGYPLSEVAFPVRVFARLGIGVLVVTNASGGISEHLEEGDLMLLTDHLNLLGESPLKGPNDDRFGPRFPDMTECYPARLREVVRRATPEGDPPPKEGVYAALHGPTYETPAEVRMLERLGADVVGMSTVPEVTVARHMGIPCVGISGVANKAAGLVSGHRLTHEEVTQTMARTGERFCRLLQAAIPALWREVAGA